MTIIVSAGMWWVVGSEIRARFAALMVSVVSVVSGTTRALACGAGRLARRGFFDDVIGEGADDHGRGGRAPQDQGKWL